MEIEQNIFFDEFKNKLAVLEYSLLNVKIEEYTKEDVNEIFRSIHTIKSTADLLGMIDVVSITHKTEDLLEFIREDKIKMDKIICALLLDLKKFIEFLVDNVSQGIFDDSMAEKLFIDFEKELNYQINIAENTIYEYVDLKTILIVDDSSLTRYQMKKIATDAGYNVLTTEDAISAWKIIQENAIDLVFCDFTLPNDKSLELVKKIKNDIKIRNLSIVMLLDKYDKEYNSLGKLIFAKAWLSKPISETQLKVVLKKLL